MIASSILQKMANRTIIIQEPSLTLLKIGVMVASFQLDGKVVSSKDLL